MGFSYKNNTDLLDDFIIDCDSIPIWQTNRDYKPIIPEFTMKVSSLIDDTLIDEDEPIDVYYNNDTYPIFSGYVTRKQYNTESRAWEVSVTHNLGKLREYYITYANLHSVLSTGATAQQYLGTDNQGYPSTQLSWVLKKMFGVAGLTLDTQDVDDVFLEQIVADGAPRDIYFKHLRLDENMLYAINQPVASLYSTYDLYPDYVQNRITFWDFVSTICQLISNYYAYDDFTDGLVASGLIMRNTISTDTSPTAKAVRLLFGNNTIYNITSGAITRYDEDTITPDEGGVRVEKFSATSRAAYASGSETAIASAGAFIFGDGINYQPIYKNLLISYEAFWLGAGYTGSNFLSASFPIYVNIVSALCFKYNVIKASLAPINIAVALYAKSLSVNVADQLLEYEQELIQEISGI